MAHGDMDDQDARRAAAEELWGRLRAIEEQNEAIQVAVFAALHAAIDAGADTGRLTNALQELAAMFQRKGADAGVRTLDRLLEGLERLY